jgi:hypothetical protein
MGRQKKIKSLQVKEKEVVMTDVVDIPDQLQMHLPGEEKVSNDLEVMQQELDQARIDLENTKREISERKHQLETLKFTPGREISAEEKVLVEKQINMTNERKAGESIIEKQRQHDSVMVTGRFMNRRAPGQGVKLPYLKHSTDPVKWYPLEDGKVYTIPRGFADQLNGGTDDDPCYYTPKFIKKEGDMDPNKPESAIHAVDSTNKKYGFVPLNF